MSKYVLHNQAVFAAWLCIAWGIFGLPAYYFMMQAFIDLPSVFFHASIAWMLMEGMFTFIFVVSLNECYEEEKNIPEKQRKKVRSIRKLLVKPHVRKVIVHDD